MKTKHKMHIRTKACILMACAAAVIAALIIALYIFGKPIDCVIMEAGDDIPSSGSFFEGISLKVSYKDTSNVKTDSVGTYKVTVKNGIFCYESSIRVQDTAEPKVKFKDIPMLPVNNPISPWELIDEVIDATSVKAEIEEEIDVSVFGRNKVTVTVTDEGGNKVSGEVDFYIVDPEVNDTDPPVAELVEKTIYEGDVLPAQELVTNIKDESEVVVSYESEPDFSKAGDVPVRILLSDIYNNSTVYDAIVKVIKDETPPVITGVKDRYTYIGEVISVKSGVRASDDRDGELEVDVEGNVDFDKEGKYTINYIATDSSGNSASISADIYVGTGRSVEERVDEQINAVLANIIKENMSDVEKARAVYNWTIKSIVYVGTSVKNNIYEAALDGLLSRKGDCYTYFAVSKIMLNKLGITNIDIERSLSSVRESRHYWLAINLGDGWYQFDASPKNKYKPFDSFMFTKAQALAYNEQVPGYYTIDEEKYPELE